MTDKKCGNCAWYCHTDGKCYGTIARLYGIVPSFEERDARKEACGQWQFDGLEDWERTPSFALMDSLDD